MRLDIDNITYIARRRLPTARSTSSARSLLLVFRLSQSRFVSNRPSVVLRPFLSTIYSNLLDT